jgi:hypothetical protein
MRKVRLALLIAIGLAATGCQTTRDSYEATRTGVVRGAVVVRDGFGEAVTQPLEDLNIKRKLIPAVLLRAEKDPYRVDDLETCEAIAAEVGRLDDALGPDMDEPPPPRVRGQGVGEEVGEATLSGIRSATTDFIPMRGWVRRLTGAQRHSLKVQRAIRAGAMRRSYLKGIGMQHNCNPPAAPKWFKPERVDYRAAQAGVGASGSGSDRRN